MLILCMIRGTHNHILSINESCQLVYVSIRVVAFQPPAPEPHDFGDASQSVKFLTYVCLSCLWISVHGQQAVAGGQQTSASIKL